jgi:hypothetical protein
MGNVTADLVVNKNLFAKGTVDVYNVPNGKVFKQILDGGIVGTVYSWVTSNGEIWWMFYNTYGIPYYVKHDSNKLSLRELPAILKQIEDKQITEEISQKGALNYYLQKYLPWIAGAVVIAIAFPAIYKNVKK